MDLIKHYGKLILYFVIALLLGSIFISVGYYFFLNSKVIKILSFIYLILVFLILSFKEGKKAEAKGYLTGIKTGLIFILIMFLVSLFLKTGFSFNKIIYYLILLFVAILGSTIGINMKKNKN